MEQFIRTKIVEAEPMSRSDWHESKEWLIPIPMEEEWDGEGYKVRYADGYESWSPKEVFEAAYRRTDGMSFGLAIEAAKMGKKIARKGWNGKGMYVFLVHGVDFHTDADLSELDDQDVEVLDCLVMRTATGAFCPGWLASQTDMLADDWMLLPDCGMMSWPQAEEAIKAGKAVCRMADGWKGVHFVGLIEEPEELAGKVCKVMKDGTIHPDWEPSPDDLTGSDWFEVYLPGKED